MVYNIIILSAIKLFFIVCYILTLFFINISSKISINNTMYYLEANFMISFTVSVYTFHQKTRDDMGASFICFTLLT